MLAGTRVKISEQKLIYYYSIKSVIYSNFLFILNFLFLSLAPTQDSIQHLQVVWQFLRLSLVLDDLDSFEECWPGVLGNVLSAGI